MNLLVVCLIVCLGGASNAVCLFPRFLQQTIANETRSDWRGRIREQYTQFGFRVTFIAALMVAEPMQTTELAWSFQRECLEQISDEKYLVRHIEGKDGPVTMYVCMEFVKRSTFVVQLRSGPLRDWPDRDTCLDNQMKFDTWLLVDNARLMAGERADRIRCPLQGGFSIRIFDKIRQQGICDGYRGETRLESECVRDDGLYLYFRHQNCVPKDLYMYSVQRTLCLATWHEDNFAFILLRHDRLEYAWVLRYPAVLLEDSFTAYLFKDLVADASEHAIETRNYLRLDTVRDTPRPVTSLCVDEYDVCSVWNEPCTSGPHMALTCPRTCAICNESRPVACAFSAELIGDWLDIFHSGRGANTVQLTINRTALTVVGSEESDVETFHCVSWNSPRSKAAGTAASATTDDMLVTEYFNGCRPRYTCLRIQRKSSAVILVKLSQTMTWPLGVTSSTDPIDCRMFSYDHDESTEDTKLRTRHSRILYLRDLRGFVQCRLPTGYNQTLRDADGTECTGSVTEINGGTGFMLNFDGCSSASIALPSVTPSLVSPSFSAASSHPRKSANYSGLFLCLKSSRISPTGDLVLVTRTGSPMDVVIHCWVSVTRGAQLYWLDARHCNETLRRQIQRDRLSPIAVISKWSPDGARNAAFADADDVTDYVTADVTTTTRDSGRPPRLWTKTSDQRSHSGEGWLHRPLNASDAAEVALGKGNGTSGTVRRKQGEKKDVQPEDEVAPNAFVIMAAVIIFALLQIPCLCTNAHL